MNQHPYLRAYLAGIAVPTPVLLGVMTAYAVFRYVYNFPVPVERFIVFPMAVVPNAWGLWNVVFIAWSRRLPLSLGLHGALLPILLAPLGMVATGILKISIPNFVAHAFPVLAPVALIVYYLAWKYLVGFLNRVLALA
jgi:ABC-type sulfate transport system permease subunit